MRVAPNTGGAPHSDRTLRACGKRRLRRDGTSAESVVETHIRSRTGTFVGAAQVPKERSSALLEGAF